MSLAQVQEALNGIGQIDPSPEVARFNAALEEHQSSGAAADVVALMRQHLRRDDVRRGLAPDSSARARIAAATCRSNAQYR